MATLRFQRALSSLKTTLRPISSEGEVESLLHGMEWTGEVCFLGILERLHWFDPGRNHVALHKARRKEGSQFQSTIEESEVLERQIASGLEKGVVDSAKLHIQT